MGNGENGVPDGRINMGFRPSKYVRVALSVIILFASWPAFATSDVFPRPAGLEPDIRFWTRVYTEIDTNAGLIHDARSLAVVYEIIRFPKGASQRKRNKLVRDTKKKYQRILTTLASGKRSRLSADEKRVLIMWSESVSKTILKRASGDVRFQLGQSNRFREGLIRSGAWQAHMRVTFRDAGLPEELASLPHVESSFNTQARSKVGAAGMWQFTRSTGRRFLQIDHVVDERFDPYKATRAATQLLNHNLAVTGSMPLALTAYNHGAAGMRRAAQKLGTQDIETIVRKYRSRTFGFASRNFYVAFLAAVDVEKDAQKYFGDIRKLPIDASVVVRMSDYIPVFAITKQFGVSQSALKKHNPSLMASVWRGDKHIPKDFALRFPESYANRDTEQLMAGVSSDDRHPRQRPDLFHRVERGDTLSGIAAYYGISVRDLTELNALRSRNFIRAGQRLRLPLNGPNTQPGTQAIDGVYVVRKGDTVSTIARQLRIDEQVIIAANDIGDGSRIFAGQSLRVVPGKSANKIQPQRASLQAPPVPPSPQSAKPALAPKDLGIPAVPAVQVVAVEPAVSAPDSYIDVLSAALTEQDLVAFIYEPVGNEPAVDSLRILEVEENAEPVSETEMADLGPSLAGVAHAPVSADPTDYSIADNTSIEVQALETLGHYAEWLDIRASQLRRINKIPFGKPVVIGKRLDLDFSKVDTEKFVARRMHYHANIQADFFARYRIDGVRNHVVKRGDSLWLLSVKRYDVPVWLLRQYNPDLDIDRIRPGTNVIFPMLSTRPGISDPATESLDAA